MLSILGLIIEIICLDGIINDSKEYYLKDDKEKKLLYYLIDEALKEKYHLKITDKEKLIVEKL